MLGYSADYTIFCLDGLSKRKKFQKPNCAEWQEIAESATESFATPARGMKAREKMPKLKPQTVIKRAEQLATIMHNIDKLIIKNGIKQADVARYLEARPQYLNTILKGNRIMPLEWVMPICEMLGCSPNDLFGYESEGEE